MRHFQDSLPSPSLDFFLLLQWIQTSYFYYQRTITTFCLKAGLILSQIEVKCLHFHALLQTVCMFSCYLHRCPSVLPPMVKTKLCGVYYQKRRWTGFCSCFERKQRKGLKMELGFSMSHSRCKNPITALGSL